MHEVLGLLAYSVASKYVVFLLYLFIISTTMSPCCIHGLVGWNQRIDQED